MRSTLRASQRRHARSGVAGTGNVTLAIDQTATDRLRARTRCERSYLHRRGHETIRCIAARSSRCVRMARSIRSRQRRCRAFQRVDGVGTVASGRSCRPRQDRCNRPGRPADVETYVVRFIRTHHRFRFRRGRGRNRGCRRPRITRMVSDHRCERRDLRIGRHARR